MNHDSAESLSHLSPILHGGIIGPSWKHAPGRWRNFAFSQLKPVSERIPISDSTLLMLIQDGNCEGLSLLCCPNLRKIKLSLGSGHPAQPCEFIEKCLSTVTSTQLSEVVFDLPRDEPDFVPPGVGLSRWDSLDVILHKLAGQYRPQCEGDKMVVEFRNPYTTPSRARNFLPMYGERGTLRVIPGL